MSRDDAAGDDAAGDDAAARDAADQDAADGSPVSPREQRNAVRQRYAAIGAGRDDERASCCDDRSPSGDSGAPPPGDSGASLHGDDGVPSCCDDGNSSCCDDGNSSCCDDGTAESRSLALGYSREELGRVPDGANLGLGCGNPTAVAGLEEGETVLDLGSGGGFDCFLAARAVGEDGRAIGVDMTPEMVERARANAETNAVENVEFRLGEIEHLPVPDEHVDVVVSNCVLNLSPEKGRVLEEAYRVLRPGGRLAIADVVTTGDAPPDDRGVDPERVAACVAGAATVDDLENLVERAGFESVSIRPKGGGEAFARQWSDGRPPENSLASAVVEGEKPRDGGEKSRDERTRSREVER